MPCRDETREIESKSENFKFFPVRHWRSLVVCARDKTLESLLLAGCSKTMEGGLAVLSITSPPNLSSALLTWALISFYETNSTRCWRASASMLTSPSAVFQTCALVFHHFFSSLSLRHAAVYAVILSDFVMNRKSSLQCCWHNLCAPKTGSWYFSFSYKFGI